MKAVASINDFLEVSELFDRSQNGREFSVVDTAVVKNDSVDELVEMLECLGESIAMADAERVTLEAESLLVHVIEDW